MAGRAVSIGGGSPPHVRTANDGSLQERGQSDHNRDTPGRHPTTTTLAIRWETAEESEGPKDTRHCGKKNV